MSFSCKFSRGRWAGCGKARPGGNKAGAWSNQVRTRRIRGTVEADVANRPIGKLSLDGNEYSLNEKFQQDALLLADEIDIDELDAARCLLDSHDDPSVLGRSLLECGIIRFHQQRKYVLDALRLLLELDGMDDEVEEASPLEGVRMFVAARLFQAGPSGSKRLVPRCMAAMVKIRSWLQRLGDKIAAAQTLSQGTAGGLSEEMETVEFSRLSLIQQHEQLGVILCRCIEKRQAEMPDFLDFISILKKADRYDTLLGKLLVRSHSWPLLTMEIVHLIPAIGAYISAFASTEGGYDLIRVRELNNKLFPQADDSTWPLPHLHAAFRAWWLAEYSGFYLDDPPEAAIPANTDLDEGKQVRYCHNSPHC